MNPSVYATMLLCTLAASVPGTLKHVNSSVISPAPERDSLIGLFQGAGGETVMVWSPVAGQLAAGFGNGEVRGLARQNSRYSYGSALGIMAPEEGAFTATGDSVRWERPGIAAVTLRRVALVERDVQFTNGRTQLRGTTILPPGAGPFPAIVMLHGSGAETRETSRIFAYLLASQGVASLIYDKRSVGQSKGGSIDDSFADFAGDAIAGMRELQRMSEIRPDRVGMFGPSQGAWIALEASRRARNVAFLWLQSGDALSPLEQEIHRGAMVVASRKLSASDSIALQTWRRLKFDYSINGKEPKGWKEALATARAASWFSLTGDGLPNRVFWHNNGHFDPLPILETTKIPLLAVFGARDTNKDAALNARLMREAFAKAGNERAEVLVIENANHGLFETMSGKTLEQEFPNLTRLAPGYIEAIRAFVEKNVLPR